MAKKLKTKIVFTFDTEQLEESFPQVVCDVDMKTNSTNKSIIIEVKKKSKKFKQDASTRLF